MTIAERRNTMNFTGAESAVEVNTRPSQSRKYERIIVFLDGSSAAERAIPEAIDLARSNQAYVVMICRDHAGAEAYINGKAGELRHQHIDAHGYVISGAAPKSPVWLVESEKADAVFMTHKHVGRLGRWLGGDAVASLRARTSADVFDIEV